MTAPRVGLAARCAAGAVAAAAALLGAAVGSAQPTEQVYSTNPGAEGGTTAGWSGSGWGAGRYSDEAIQQGGADSGSSNEWLFVSGVGGEDLVQTVPVDAAAQEIDGNQDHFSVVASLGGSGAGSSGASVLAQPQDAQGQPLGAAAQLGPPTAADRHSERELLGCRSPVNLPPGTRSVTLTLRSTPATTASDIAFADDVLLVDNGVFPAVYYPPAQGPNCSLNYAVATPTATPSATPPAVTPIATPTYPVTTRVRVRRVRLTHHRISFFTTAAAHFKVTIRRRQKTMRKVELAAKRRGTISHRLRTLPAGRYRVAIESGRVRRATVHRQLAGHRK